MYIVHKFVPSFVLRNSTEDTVAQECRLKFIDKEIFQIESPPGKSFWCVFNYYVKLALIINFILRNIIVTCCETSPCYLYLLLRDFFM